MRTNIWLTAIMTSTCVLALAGCAGTGSEAIDTDSPVVGSSPFKPAFATINPTPRHQAQTPAERLVNGSPEIGSSAVDSIGDTDNNLELVNDDLRSRLEVLRVGSGQTDNHLLSVFAGIKNKTSHPLQLEMQTVYEDKAGTPLSKTKGSWIPVTLKPHQSTQYRSVAISEDASQFVVRIRHAKGAGTAPVNP